MSDPYVTREMTVRDLLVHRSGLGLGAGDLLWWPPSTYNREEIARPPALLPLATSFRSAYAYDNVLYLVAGEVIEAVSGSRGRTSSARASWRGRDDDAATLRLRHRANGGNVATPHAPIDGTVRPIQPFASDNTNPAGGITLERRRHGEVDAGACCDAASWPTASRLFSERTWRNRRQTLVDADAEPGDPPPELRAAARRSSLATRWGSTSGTIAATCVLTHTGGLPGFVSRVLLVPDIGLGVSVLTNQESGEAFNALAYYVVDQLSRCASAPTGWRVHQRARRVPWRGVADAELKTAQAARAPPRRRRCRSRDTPAPTPTAWYGDIDDRRGRRQAVDSLHEDAGARRRRSNTGSTTPSSRAGPIASCAPTPSSPSRSKPDGSIEQARMRGRVAGDRLQLRLPGSAVGAKEEVSGASRGARWQWRPLRERRSHRPSTAA